MNVVETPELRWGKRDKPYHRTGEIREEDYAQHLKPSDRSCLSAILHHIRQINPLISTPIHVLAVGSSANLQSTYHDIDLLICPENPLARMTFIRTVISTLRNDDRLIISRPNQRTSSPIFRDDNDLPYNVAVHAAVAENDNDKPTKFDINFVSNADGLYMDILYFHKKNQLAFCEITNDLPDTLPSIPRTRSLNEIPPILSDIVAQIDPPGQLIAMDESLIFKIDSKDKSIVWKVYPGIGYLPLKKYQSLTSQVADACNKVVGTVKNLSGTNQFQFEWKIVPIDNVFLRNGYVVAESEYVAGETVSELLKRSDEADNHPLIQIDKEERGMIQANLMEYSGRLNTRLDSTNIWFTTINTKLVESLMVVTDVCPVIRNIK